MKNKLIGGMIVGIVATTALTACSGSGDDTDNANVPSKIKNDGCIHLVVATSSEKINMMEKLGDNFSKSDAAKGLGKCVTVTPINLASGAATNEISKMSSTWPLADKDYWPTLWSPASTLWTDRVTGAGAGAVLDKPVSFAETPVVFAMPQRMAQALGYPQKPVSIAEMEALIKNPNGWGSVGHPLWGSFKIAKTNPNTSTTGLETILMQSYAASNKTSGLTVNDVNKAASFSQTFESGAIHYGDTTGNVLTTISKSSGSNSNYVSAVAVEETSLFNYNKGNPDSHTVQPGETLTPPSEKLVAVYPKEGSMISDDPIVSLKAPWVTSEQQKANQAFVTYLQSRDAQQVLPEYGFRPVMKGIDVSQYLNGSVGIDPNQPKTILAKPSTDVVSAALDQWTQIRKPSSVLELIDISGSMKDSAGNGSSKIDGAIKSAQSTLGNFRSTDNVGVWAFTTDISSHIGKNIVPVQEYGPLGADVEKTRNEIGDLAQANMNGTPLYDSIGTAYDYMTKQAQNGRINAIVVLTDGADTNSSMSLESLLVKLNSGNKEGANNAPVRIFTIAYGGDADKNVLKRISDATGGQMFDASDPTKIQSVFTSVINNF